MEMRETEEEVIRDEYEEEMWDGGKREHCCGGEAVRKLRAEDSEEVVEVEGEYGRQNRCVTC